MVSQKSIGFCLRLIDMRHVRVFCQTLSPSLLFQAEIYATQLQIHAERHVLLQRVE